MKYIFITFVLITSLFSKDTIIVSVPPQKYFIEQIAKDNFTIVSMMDEESVMPEYQPTGAQYVWTEDAVAYFKIGLFKEFRWIKSIKIKNSNIKVYDTLEDTKLNISSEYVWLDPIMVRFQAKSILNALVDLDSKNKEFYKKNYFKFVNKLSALDYQLRIIFKNKKRNHFIVFHPYWDYYVKRYNLLQFSLESNPFDFSNENVSKMVTKLNKYSSNLLLVPKYYFPKSTLKRIEDNTKLLVVPFSHLEYDWANNLLNLARLITNQP
jgi:zinc transport system substrate-binding protein